MSGRQSEQRGESECWGAKGRVNQCHARAWTGGGERRPVTTDLSGRLCPRWDTGDTGHGRAGFLIVLTMLSVGALLPWAGVLESR